MGNDYRRNLKRWIIVICIGMLVVAGTGNTIAYLAKKTDKVTNIFSYAKVSCQIEEESFDGNEKRNVTVKNTSNINVYIRCKVVVNWQGKEGIYGIPPVDGSDYNMNLNLGSGWVEKEGTYFYSQPVKPNESTPVLINSCREVKKNAPKGYRLSVDVMAEAIQSEPELAREKAWGY